MKSAAWIVLGIVVGFLLGGVPVRRQLTKTKDEIHDLQARLDAAEKRARRGNAGRFLPIPDLPVPAPRTMPTASPKEGAKEDDEGEGEEETARQTPEDAKRAFDLAVDAQRMRAKQSRGALREQGGLSDKEMEEADLVLAKMNEKLREFSDEILKMATMEKEPTAAELLELSHDVTGVLFEAQQGFDAIPGTDSVDEPSRQVWNYVDLEIFRGAFDAALASGQLD